MYGYSQVHAVSQTGLPVVRACYPQNSACYVEISYFDQNGDPWMPEQISYSIDDLVSGLNILAWTTIPQGQTVDTTQTIDGDNTVDEVPSVTSTILITSAQNAMISLSRSSESHRVIFQITDEAGNNFYATCDFDLVRVIPIPNASWIVDCDIAADAVAV